MNHSREIAGLWARALTASTAVGGEAEAYAYCNLIGGRAMGLAACLDGLRRSERHGPGVLRSALSRALRPARSEGRKSVSWVAGKRPTHRNTLSPYQDDDEGGGSIGATTGSNPGSEVQA